jgi:serine/threonine-protein phosphatase 2A regulatory subunit B
VDIVSAIEFDHTGDFLAAGDRGGRVVIFQREECADGKGTNYKFYHEFQSHEPEFDYLKSLEIEEKINKIKWFKPQKNGMFLLTTNDKTIKLWKVHDKVVPTLDTERPTDGQSLYVPRVTSRESVTSATPRKIFSNAHAYHVNSISLNSDGETYISSDDLRINLWNLEINDQSFSMHIFCHSLTLLSLSLSFSLFLSCSLALVGSLSRSFRA